MANSKLSPKARLFIQKASAEALASVVMELGTVKARDDVAALLSDTDGEVLSWSPEARLLTASVPAEILEVLSDIRGVTSVELAEPLYTDRGAEPMEDDGPP